MFLFLFCPVTRSEESGRHAKESGEGREDQHSQKNQPDDRNHDREIKARGGREMLADRTQQWIRQGAQDPCKGMRLK